MKHRSFRGQQEPAQYRPLPPEHKALQREKASCKLIVKFNDGNRHTKWSNEWAQPNKFRNISEAINEMFKVFDIYWRKNAHSAVIFDTRIHKDTGAHNKIYQYENGIWKTVNPFTW